MAFFPGYYPISPYVTADLNLVPVYTPPPPPAPIRPAGPDTSTWTDQTLSRAPTYRAPLYSPELVYSADAHDSPEPTIVEPVIPAPLAAQYTEARKTYDEAIVIRSRVPVQIDALDGAQITQTVADTRHLLNSDDAAAIQTLANLLQAHEAGERVQPYARKSAHDSRHQNHPRFDFSFR